MQPRVSLLIFIHVFFRDTKESSHDIYNIKQISFMIMNDNVNNEQMLIMLKYARILFKKLAFEPN